MAKSGSIAQIGISGFFCERELLKNKNDEYRHGIDVSWARNERPRVSTSSFVGEIQAMFYGFDMAGLLKGILSELPIAGIDVEIPTYVGRDYLDDAYQVESANIATSENGRMGV